MAGSISNSDTPSYHGCLRVPCRPFTHWPSEGDGVGVRSRASGWRLSSFFFCSLNALSHLYFIPSLS